MWTLLAPAPETTPLPPTLTLKDGRVLYLTAPPRTEGSRVIFTTVGGKTYTLQASEVESFVDAPPTPTRTPRRFNPQDSHNLGAIARQERAKTGKTTDLSSAPPKTPGPAKSPKPTLAPGKAAATHAKKKRTTVTPTPAAPTSPATTPR